MYIRYQNIFINVNVRHLCFLSDFYTILCYLYIYDEYFENPFKNYDIIDKILDDILDPSIDISEEETNGWFDNKYIDKDYIKKILEKEMELIRKYYYIFVIYIKIRNNVEKKYSDIKKQLREYLKTNNKLFKYKLIYEFFPITVNF